MNYAQLQTLKIGDRVITGRGRDAGKLCVVNAIAENGACHIVLVKATDTFETGTYAGKRDRWITHRELRIL